MITKLQTQHLRAFGRAFQFLPPKGIGIDPPEVISLHPAETDDGQEHEAVRNIVWFSTEAERDSNPDVAATFELTEHGRTFYGGEIIYYLD
jgi:hypothetical protein